MTESNPAEASDRGFRLSHVFDAAREAVFSAWTDPAQVAKWWSPDGFEIPLDTVEIEPQVGGRFQLTMVESAGGARYPLRAEILEISEPDLIVIRSEPIPDAGILEPTITRVVFEAEGERTRMTLTDGPYTEEMRPNAEAGWVNLVANLDALLGS